jgi:hypothetical protein
MNPVNTQADSTLTTHVRLVPRLGNCGDIPPLPDVSSRHGVHYNAQTSLFLYVDINICYVF